MFRTFLVERFSVLLTVGRGTTVILRTAVASLFATLALSAELSASTLTFAGGVDCFGFDEQAATCAQNGFSYQTSIAYAIPGTMYLHDDSGVLASQVKRLDGGRFNAYGAELWGRSLLYEAIVGPSPTGELEYLNDGQLMHLERVQIAYGVEGFRNGSLVASTQHAIPSDNPRFGAYSPVSWGNLFADIDRLVISLLLPEDRYDYAEGVFGWPWELDPDENLFLNTGEYYCQEWCGDLVVDSLHVAEVPLPATLPLFLAGFGFLGLLKAKKRN